MIASESPVETRLRIYLCRDRFETLTALLKPAFGGSPRRARRRGGPLGKTAGEDAPPRGSRSNLQGNGVNSMMLDLFYVAIGCMFLLACWAFTKACDKL